MKTSVQRVLTTLTLLCLTAVGPKAQAVTPAPDGGYPGGNTAEGANALFSLTTGGYNTAVGFLSLGSNATGQFNTAIGAGTLLVNTADQNTATGAGALLNNTTGPYHTANGAFALFSNTTGGENTANGYQALFSNTTGNLNTAVGAEALYSNTSGIGNTSLGAGAGSSVTTANHVICIGSGGANVSNTCFIGNIRGVPTQNADAIPVLIDSAGQLGTISSSRRFKKDIEPMDKASEKLLALKPVTFHYKSDTKGVAQFGLVAEEVAEVNPDLVIRDPDGKPYTVRYEAVNAMLLNEFLKEHKAFLQEQSKVQKLQAALDTVNQRLKEQEAKIERVSAQVEMNKPAPRVAGNN